MTRGGRVILALLLPVPLLLVACEQGPAVRSAEQVRDSSGVRIVEWSEPPSSVGRTLSIDESWGPAEPLEFGRLIDLEVMPDGRVALLDGMEGRVTVLDPDGRVGSAFGRVGEGPGEWSIFGLSQLMSTDSSVLVPDVQLQRMNEFSPTGDLLELRGLLESAAPGEGPVFYGLDWRTHPLGGTLHRRLTEAGDMIIRMHEGSIDTLHVQTFENRGPNVVLEPVLLWALDSEGRLLLARSDRPRLELRDPSTEDPIWIVRGLGSEIAVGDRERDRVEEIFLEAARSSMGEFSEDQRARILASFDVADRAPVFAAIHPVPEGGFWVQRAKAVSEMDAAILAVGSAAGAGSTVWEVIGPSGLREAGVRLPEGFTPLRFQERWIYGVLEDDLGVQRVVRVARD